MRLAKVDEQGLFIEDVIVKEYPLIEVDGEMVKDESYVSAPSQGGLYKPKWTGTEWVEGLTEQEVQTIKDNVIHSLSTAELLEIIDKKLEANLNATRKLVKQSTLTDEKLIEFVNIYPSWKIGKALEVDDILKYEDELYRVVQSHTTQSDWTPNISQSLFAKIQPAGVIPIWVQPTGASDAYDIGFKVEFEGSVYESVIDANTYSPTAYPAGWNVV